MKFLIAVGAVALTCLIGAQFITIFVIQPIGAIPDGRTLLISRLNTLNFIDSADAWCERKLGGVNLFCRGMATGRIANQATIIARLPYSDMLYQISTGGRTYER